MRQMPIAFCIKLAYYLPIMDILYLVALKKFKASQSRGFFMPEINIRLAVTFGQSYMCIYEQ